MTQKIQFARLVASSERMASALERLADHVDPPPQAFSENSPVTRWDAARRSLRPVPHRGVLSMALLQGIEEQKSRLYANTLQFALGCPANNALLWGAKGTGKSSLVISVHAQVCAEINASAQSTPASQLFVIYLLKEDVGSLKYVLEITEESAHKFIIFCDDFSFDQTNNGAVKSLLDGGHALAHPNVLFYATSNLRHLAPKSMQQNAEAVHQRDLLDQHLSLADRFGLSLGFHQCDKPTWLRMVNGYMAKVAASAETLAVPLKEVVTLDDLDIEPNPMENPLPSSIPDSEPSPFPSPENDPVLAYYAGQQYRHLPWYASAIAWGSEKGFSGRHAWQFVIDWCGTHRYQINL